MKSILSTLNEITGDAFSWDAQRADPLAALMAGGLDPAQAAETLADLRRQGIHKSDDSWQSCDACFDPGSDPDQFDCPHAR